MCDNTYLFTELHNRNVPGTIFSIKMENDDYLVRIKYLDINYQEDLKNGTLQADAIDIGIQPKQKHLPQILFLLETPNTKQHIGIDLCQSGFLNEQAIDTYCHKLQYAQTVIHEIKNCIRTYFPGVLKQ